MMMSGSLFEKQVVRSTGCELASEDLETLQVNLGLRCNQSCRHCHVSASPSRTETMEWTTMERVLDVASQAGCGRVDLTGGAPELNPHFQRFVRRLRTAGRQVQVRTNLTVLLEPGMESMPAFFREWGVQLVASLPCYQEENVRAQRGRGVYEKSIAAIRRLNDLGYGIDPNLCLNLVYNPGGSFLPPVQTALENDYRRELQERFGLTFSSLLTLINMPIGRYLEDLRGRNEEQGYRTLLRETFNPQTLQGLMCRHQINVGWDGTLYDCDFNMALGLPVNHGAPDHILDFDRAALCGRKIVTGDHCFGCTAGSGSSCGGSLA
jgi:radical SAM/Cys-rich protein